MVPIWSSATAGGIPLIKLDGLHRDRQQKVFERTKTSGAECIKLKGGAGWAVGLTIAEVIHPIALNQPKVLPISTQLTGEYGIRGTCTSLPTLVDRTGVVKRYEIELWPREISALQPARSRWMRRMRRCRSNQNLRRITDRSNEITRPKIASIRANPSGAKDFILADAKDADMAVRPGRAGKDPRTGQVPLAGRVSRSDARDHQAGPGRHHADVRQHQRPADDQRATVRELARHPRRPRQRHDRYPPPRRRHLRAEPSRPFRTATIEQIQSGEVNAAERTPAGSDLGLYSITPNNKLDFDYVTLEAYKAFRIEAEAKGFRHFLEVFDPNACGGSLPGRPGPIYQRPDRPHAGRCARSGRPVFLKIAYHGPKAMEELAAYDPRWSRAFSAVPAAPPTMRSSCWKKPKSTAPAPHSSAARSTTASISSPSSRFLSPSPTEITAARGRARPITATWRS